MEEEAVLGVSYRSFDELLKESDVLSIHAPLTDETRDIISFDELSKMKETAVNMNTSRKEVIDEEAVSNALDSGKLFGFGTDFKLDRSISGLENI
ncbi:hypothetical protein FJY84_04225 [Candidatus Bathyarchaeota archaeon]|nr:hypothetical protein [Candidatus Bathyarchaeota archaeon]